MTYGFYAMVALAGFVALRASHPFVRLFIALARTAADATEYFQIPTGRVVEVGTQVTV